MMATQTVRADKGFSLIELMIVIGLIGIMGAIGLYAWQGYRVNTNLKTAARGIATDIEASKQRAMTEGIRYRLTFAAGGTSYTIAPDPFTSAQTKLLSDIGPGLSIVSTTFTSGQLTFLPRGTLSGLGGSVVLGNSRGSQATVTVNVTGRAHVAFAIQ